MQENNRAAAFLLNVTSGKHDFAEKRGIMMGKSTMTIHNSIIRNLSSIIPNSDLPFKSHMQASGDVSERWWFRAMF